jgi:hypothetical protein
MLKPVPDAGLTRSFSDAWHVRYFDVAQQQSDVAREHVGFPTDLLTSPCAENPPSWQTGPFASILAQLRRIAA